MTVNTENIPMISSTEIQEIPTDMEALNRLLADLTRLQTENKALRDRAASKAAGNPDSLPQFATYDTKLFASIDDIAFALHKAKICESADDVTDARYFVKLFGLCSQAQLKDTGVRGRGKLLYLCPEVKLAIGRILESRR